MICCNNQTPITQKRELYQLLTSSIPRQVPITDEKFNNQDINAAIANNHIAQHQEQMQSHSTPCPSSSLMPWEPPSGSSTNYRDFLTVPVDTIVNQIMVQLPCSKRKGPRGGVAIPFPEKLYNMLLDTEAKGMNDIVSWQAHGRCFFIHQPEAFVEKILPRYFRQSKLTSFQRQSNLYGFQRLTSGRDRGGYYHELFLRGRPDLCKIHRRHNASNDDACNPCRNGDNQNNRSQFEPNLWSCAFAPAPNTKPTKNGAVTNAQPGEAFSFPPMPVPSSTCALSKTANFAPVALDGTSNQSLLQQEQVNNASMRRGHYGEGEPPPHNEESTLTARSATSSLDLLPGVLQLHPTKFPLNLPTSTSSANGEEVDFRSCQRSLAGSFPFPPKRAVQVPQQVNQVPTLSGKKSDASFSLSWALSELHQQQKTFNEGQSQMPKDQVQQGKTQNGNLSTCNLSCSAFFQTLGLDRSESIPTGPSASANQNQKMQAVTSKARSGHKKQPSQVEELNPDEFDHIFDDDENSNNSAQNTASQNEMNDLFEHINSIATFQRYSQFGQNNTLMNL